MKSSHGCYSSGGVSKTLEPDLMSQQSEIVALSDAEVPKLTHTLKRTYPTIARDFAPSKIRDAMAEKIGDSSGSERDLDVFACIPVTVRGSLILFAVNSFRGS
jgi:hypothetical protein